MEEMNLRTINRIMTAATASAVFAAFAALDDVLTNEFIPP